MHVNLSGPTICPWEVRDHHFGDKEYRVDSDHERAQDQKTAYRVRIRYRI